METKIKYFIGKLIEDPRTAKLALVLGSSSKLSLVGGCVRDALQHLGSRDLDFASALSVGELESCLSSAQIQTYQTGLKHETLTVLPYPGLPPVEITTFRGPTRSLEEDLLLRDFTINAIALDPWTGKLTDPASGQEDLAGKIIRAVGNPLKRFEEDPLRIMRAVRFACKNGFTLDSLTWHAAIKLVDSLKTVSIERIRDEFSRILISDRPNHGLELLAEARVLALLFPEIEAMRGCEQNKFHKADVFYHTLEVVARTEPEIILRLAALFHDISKPETLSIGIDGERHFYRHEYVGASRVKEILTRLRFSNHEIETVSNLVETHMRPLDCKAPGLRRILRDTGDHYKTWRALKEADLRSCNFTQAEVSAMLAEFDENMLQVQKEPSVSPLSALALRGGDLLELGVPFGPRIGEILRALHEKVLDDPTLNERETLLKIAESLLP
ncbi:HD domain-containing protein [bacterium]|nr:HD domain-containing protein [bacterium]